jgi:hypothetical protein
VIVLEVLLLSLVVDLPTSKSSLTNTGVIILELLGEELVLQILALA